MPRLENAGGDRLARGAASHTFKPMGEKLSRENWDKIFEEDEKPEVKATYVLNCPVHGTHPTTRECYVSGGFPQLDETLSVKCKIDDCGEITTYAGYTLVGGSYTDNQTGTVGADAGEVVSVAADNDIPF